MKYIFWAMARIAEFCFIVFSALLFSFFLIVYPIWHVKLYKKEAKDDMGWADIKEWLLNLWAKLKGTYVDPDDKPVISDGLKELIRKSVEQDHA